MDIIGHVLYTTTIVPQSTSLATSHNHYSHWLYHATNIDSEVVNKYKISLHQKQTMDIIISQRPTCDITMEHSDIILCPNVPKVSWS